MNKKVLIIILSGVLVVIVLGGGIWYLRNRSVDSVSYTASPASTPKPSNGQGATTPTQENVLNQVEPQGVKETPRDENDPAYRLLYGSTTATPSPSETPSPEPTPPPPSTGSLDPDNDGLTNLQEEQLGTDSNKADTDGDGYKDGDEVKAGYNPLGPGKLK